MVVAGLSPAREQVCAKLARLSSGLVLRLHQGRMEAQLSAGGCSVLSSFWSPLCFWCIPCFAVE